MKMKKTDRKWTSVILTVIAAVGILVLINYAAVTYCIGDLKLFTALVVIVPVVCIAATAFFLGYQIRWDWKKGICISLVLTLISFGTSQFAVFMAGDKLDSMGTKETQDSTPMNSNEKLMEELYAELDKKAYEYMLEQGLISEGEEIYGGEGTIEGKVPDNREERDAVSKEQIVSSELYVGIQKSDPVTELLGNIMTFFIAFGFSFAGNLVKSRRDVKGEN